MKTENIYLMAAVVGAIVPYIFFMDQIAVTGLDLMAFIAALFASGAAGGFTADLLISSFIFWIWMFSDGKDQPSGFKYLCIGVNLTIGLSCAFPLYLWHRERLKAHA